MADQPLDDRIERNRADPRDSNSIRHAGSRHVSTFRPLDFDENQVGDDTHGARLSALRIRSGESDGRGRNLFSDLWHPRSLWRSPFDPLE
jgi:hypothetical protein